MQQNKYYLLIFIFSIFHIILFYIVYNSNISFENNLLFFKKIIRADLNLSTTGNYRMIGYINAPFNPSYGLYDFTFYFNGPGTSSQYSSLVIHYYKTPGASP